MVLSRGYLGRMRLLIFLTVPIPVLKVLLRCALYSQRWPSSQACRKVRRFANDCLLLRSTRSDQVADNDQPCRNADTRLQRRVDFQAGP
jgi:hypothetical protein